MASGLGLVVWGGREVILLIIVYCGIELVVGSDYRAFLTRVLCWE